MEFIKKLFDSILGRPAFQVAEPGFDPMDESVRTSKQRGCGGLIFWIFIISLMISGYVFVNGRQKEKARQANEAIALSVKQTEASYTSTLTITLTPTITPTATEIPFTPTNTPTITTTPATATSSPTPSLTPAPKIIYQDRTVVITVRVPWVITVVVPQTVIVVVTATDTPTPTETSTPTATGTITETPTPTVTPTP